MTRRMVAVLVPRPSRRPDGFPPDDLRMAMAEDVYETVAALELVEPALAVQLGDPATEAVEAMAWPGSSLHAVPRADGGGSYPLRALRILDEAGADQATLVSGDAPDLPGLLIGKLHRALGSADVAVLPAQGGGLVAVAVRCPLPGWLVAEDLELDAEDMTVRLRARAPRRTALSVGPGWHRVRAPADLARRDASLEGWDVTRALLRR
ncbi:MAG: DUF2064 domain-containing protein [Actinomycetes bacterium]